MLSHSFPRTTAGAGAIRGETWPLIVFQIDLDLLLWVSVIMSMRSRLLASNSLQIAAFLDVFSHVR